MKLLNIILESEEYPKVQVDKKTVYQVALPSIKKSVDRHFNTILSKGETLTDSTEKKYFEMFKETFEDNMDTFYNVNLNSVYSYYNLLPNYDRDADISKLLNVFYGIGLKKLNKPINKLLAKSLITKDNVEHIKKQAKKFVDYYERTLVRSLVIPANGGRLAVKRHGIENKKVVYVGDESQKGSQNVKSSVGRLKGEFLTKAFKVLDDLA